MSKMLSVFSKDILHTFPDVGSNHFELNFSIFRPLSETQVQTQVQMTLFFPITKSHQLGDVIYKKSNFTIKSKLAFRASFET